MAVIPKPPFPNVPNVAGVPQLSRSLNFPPAPLPVLGLALALGKLWQSIFAQPQWGIYKSNPGGTQDAVGDDIPTVRVVATRVPVVVPDSFGEFSYRNKFNMSDYPVQDGGFASYNKVNNPFEITLRLYKGGTKEERKKFLDSLDAIAGTLTLYDIITPEKTYLNVNVMEIEIARRGPRGAFFLSEVDVIFREIRQVTASYTTTSTLTLQAQNVDALPPINTGSIQAQELPSSVRNSLGDL